MIRPAIALSLCALLTAPSLALAQASKAGVVTTLEGNVTARRVALPGSVPLKFKDDVFLQDTVTTGEKSLARMLLGGKAVVTVRERSVLTITEVPGRSTIELDSGKFALAVAREKMRPGEEIHIRTPNAVAGVRGTVVITEVNRQSAQAGGAAPAVVTNFYVLRGTITAQQLDPGTRQPLGTPLNVGALQTYSQAGNAAGRVAPVPPEQVSQITAGLQPTGPKQGNEVGQELVKSQAVQTAVSLVGTLTGTHDGTQVALALAPAPVAPSPEMASMNPPIVAFSSVSEQERAAIAALFEGLVLVIGNVTLTDAALKSFSGVFIGGSPFPLVRLTNAVFVQTGEGTSFIDVLSGASVSLAGPLLSLVDSAIVTSGSLLRILGGTLRSTSNSALLFLDPSSITAGDAMIAMNGGALDLAGPLLIDIGGDLRSGQELVRLSNGASLASTGTAALLSFTATHATPEGNLLRLVDGSTITLAGPLLDATGGTFESGRSNNLRSLVGVFDGSAITSTADSPLIAMTGSVVDTQGPLVNVRRSASTSHPSRISLAGPLFSGTNVAINTTSLGFGGTFGTANNCCATFSVEQGAVLSSTTSSPLISLAGSTVTVKDSQSGGSFFFVTDTVDGFPATELVAPATVSLAGPLLSASHSSIFPLFSLLSIGRSSFSSTTDSALITLTSSTVTAGGTDIHGDTTIARVLSLFSATNPFGFSATDAGLSLAGPFLSATGSSVTATQLMGVFGGATFTSTTTSPLVTLDGTSLKLITHSTEELTNHGDLIIVGGVGGGSGSQLARVTLSGPLLSVSNGSALDMSGSLANVFRGGQIVETHPTSPFASITGGTHTIASDTGNALFRLFGRSTATTVEVVSTSGLNTSTSSLTVGTDEPLKRSGSGAFLEASGATIGTEAGLTLDTALLSASAPLLSLKAGATLSTVAEAIDLVGTAKLTAIGPLVKLDGATLNIASHAIKVMNGSFLNVAGDLLSISNGGKINITNGGALFIAGGSVVKIGGGFVNFGGSGNQVNITNSFTPTAGCSTQCGPFGSHITLQNGASFGNVSISSNAIKNSSGNSVSLSGAAIILDGAGSKIIINGN